MSGSPAETPVGDVNRPAVKAGDKVRGAEKMARIPIKIAPDEPSQFLRKPKWIRADGVFFISCRHVGIGSAAPNA